MDGGWRRVPLLRVWVRDLYACPQGQPGWPDMLLVCQRQAYAVRWVELTREHSRSLAHIEHGVDEDVDAALRRGRTQREQLVFRPPSGAPSTLLVELAQVPLSTLMSRSQRWKGAERYEPSRMHHNLDPSIDNLEPSNQGKIPLTGLIALLGGGNHIWLKPISWRLDISSSRCCHQLMRSCFASHVKPCS
jgi:hypothetical protein